MQESLGNCLVLYATLFGSQTTVSLEMSGTASLLGLAVFPVMASAFLCPPVSTEHGIMRFDKSCIDWIMNPHSLSAEIYCHSTSITIRRMIFPGGTPLCVDPDVPETAERLVYAQKEINTTCVSDSVYQAGITEVIPNGRIQVSRLEALIPQDETRTTMGLSMSPRYYVPDLRRIKNKNNVYIQLDPSSYREVVVESVEMNAVQDLEIYEKASSFLLRLQNGVAFADSFIHPRLRLQEFLGDGSIRSIFLVNGGSILVKIRHPRGLECPICLGGFEEIPSIKTSCDHSFHEECLVSWLHREMNCPVCRTEFDS
jgi:hypothetical protein